MQCVNKLSPDDATRAMPFTQTELAFSMTLTEVLSNEFDNRPSPLDCTSLDEVSDNVCVEVRRPTCEPRSCCVGTRGLLLTAPSLACADRPRGGSPAINPEEQPAAGHGHHGRVLW